MTEENKTPEKIEPEKVMSEIMSRKKNIIIAAAVIVIVLAVIGFQKGRISLGELDFAKSGKTLTQDEAKDKVVNFIKENMVAEGTKLEVKSVTKEGNLYKISINIADQQDVDTYITTDGEKFFPSAIEMEKEAKKMAEAKKAQEEAAKKAAEEEAKNMKKTDKPKVDLYVMSFCPYGNKAEDTMKPVYNLLKNKVDFNFHYIVSSSGNKIESLHGEPEVVQNEREACVMKNYGKDKWMEFVTAINSKCGSDGACWEDEAKGLSIDTAKVSSCVTSSGAILMKADEKISTDAGATGSPTMIINGTKSSAAYKYGNSEEYKKAICSAFNTAPEECNKALEATATTEGGSCN